VRKRISRFLKRRNQLLTDPTKMVGALVGCGLKTSKHGDLAHPIPKPLAGAFASWAVKPAAPVRRRVDA
jgi:hypothetical protein